METATETTPEGRPDLDTEVERARRRDVRAFEALYRAHEERVYGLALRLTRDSRAAEELVQDAFVQAWRGLPGFRGDSSFATWVHAITVRAHLQARRSARKRTEREVDIDRFAFAAGRAMPGTDIDLERAIATLPDRAREVLVLYDIYGYRHREIGSMLGIAEGTAKAQLHRARKLMREFLE